MRDPDTSSLRFDWSPHDAFIWGPRRDHMRALQGLTVLFCDSETPYFPYGGSDVQFAEARRDICNFRADYVASANINPVTARLTEVDGTILPDGNTETFKIDGPSGERIVKISMKLDRPLMEQISDLKVSLEWPQPCTVLINIREVTNQPRPTKDLALSGP
jgi:hypothetical protein